LKIENFTVVKEEKNAHLIDMLKRAQKKLKENKIKITLVQGVKRVKDENTRKLIINDYHNLPTGGHAGTTRTFKNIRKKYFWPGMAKDINNFIQKCDACQRYKYTHTKKEPMVVTTTSTVALNKIYLDLIGPFPKEADENFSYALTMQCELPKFLIITPLETKEADCVARAFVEKFILLYDIPSQIASDCGKNL